MAEGILRQSYDSTGKRKIYPLTVIDGILRSVDVNVMEGKSRGAYAIIDSMKNYDVDFAKADLTTLNVMTRTWNENDRSYSNIVPILSVNDNGFKVGSEKTSTFTGPVKTLYDLQNGTKIEFGDFDKDTVELTPTGRLSTKNESNVLSGKIELFSNNNTIPFFSVENDRLVWKSSAGKVLSVGSTQLTYDADTVIKGKLRVNGEMRTDSDVFLGTGFTTAQTHLSEKGTYGIHATTNRIRLFQMRKDSGSSTIQLNTGCEGTGTTSGGKTVYDNGYASAVAAIEVSSSGEVGGISMKPHLTVDGTMTVSKSATFATDVSVLGTATVGTLKPSTLTVSGPTTFNGALTSNNTTKINNTLWTQHIYPIVSDTYNLGSSTYKYKELHADYATIYNGKVTLTDSSHTIYGGGNQIYATINGKTPLVIEENVIRSSVNKTGVDLGSTQYPWKDGYFSGVLNSYDMLATNSIIGKNIYAKEIFNGGGLNFQHNNSRLTAPLKDVGWYKIGTADGNNAASNTSILFVNMGYPEENGSEGYIISFTNKYYNNSGWTGDYRYGVVITQLNGTFGYRQLISRAAAVCSEYNTEYYIYYAGYRGSVGREYPTSVYCVGTAVPCKPTFVDGTLPDTIEDKPACSYGSYLYEGLMSSREVNITDPDDSRLKLTYNSISALDGYGNSGSLSLQPHGGSVDSYAPIYMHPYGYEDTNSNGYINNTESDNVLRIGKDKNSNGTYAVQLLAGSAKDGFSGSNAAIEVNGNPSVVTIKPKLNVYGNVYVNANKGLCMAFEGGNDTSVYNTYKQEDEKNVIGFNGRIGTGNSSYMASRLSVINGRCIPKNDNNTDYYGTICNVVLAADPENKIKYDKVKDDRYLDLIIGGKSYAGASSGISVQDVFEKDVYDQNKQVRRKSVCIKPMLEVDKLAIRDAVYQESRSYKYVSPPRGTKFYLLSDKDGSRNVYFDSVDWKCGDFCFLYCASGTANRFVKYDSDGGIALNKGIEGFYLFVCADTEKEAYVYNKVERHIRKMAYIKIDNVL